MVFDNARKQAPGPSAPAEPTAARKRLAYLFSVCVAVLFVVAFNSSAAAQTCGGADPCTCGDTVIADRTFTKADFAGIKSCPGDGLIIGDDGIELDLKGKHIKGPGSGVGIRIENRINVLVKGGRVSNFDTGVLIGSASTNVTVDDMEAYHNEANGILVQGDGNFVTASPGRHNGINGMLITGNNNIVTLSNNEYNGDHGFLVEGTGNDLISNWASENNDFGILVAATAANTLLQTNRITKLNRQGIVVEGAPDIQLIGNFVTKQRGMGIRITADDAVLTNNKVVESGGILVIGTGDGNDSSGNVSNRGTCHIYGIEDVPGICDEK
jgi:hypothetical protein